MSAEDSVLVRCPSCGENAAPRARFCENCGTALATGGADPSLPSEVTLDVAPTVLDLDPATGEAGGNRRCGACGG
ncbi:zinc ribbon domain-containing protein, partial [Promicromonospora kroppenstedtii]|uniref:zinc ribbon domain-containing protein n=1 Tax=Promicromonospora kroppenstedtii TaxID=440482 RepID=UPI0005654578